MNMPLVSIVVPTKNSSQFLEACLKSIKSQKYSNIELIVVDNGSTDNTQEIAFKFTDKVFTKGPERSVQRNFGAEQARGEYLLFIDSDMELSNEVVEDCMTTIIADRTVKGIIIPEKSFGTGFWAQCKKLEKSFYVGIDWMEAARFFEKSVYCNLGGYNEAMVSGEDWDLSQRVEAIGNLGRIVGYIYHNEGKIDLAKTVQKKTYYAKHLKSYADNANNQKNLKNQTGIFKRYELFFSQPKKLFEDPVVGLGMLFMKTCEFGCGGMGYIVDKFFKK